MDRRAQARGTHREREEKVALEFLLSAKKCFEVCEQRLNEEPVIVRERERERARGENLCDALEFVCALDEIGAVSLHFERVESQEPEAAISRVTGTTYARTHSLLVLLLVPKLWGEKLPIFCVPRKPAHS
jgi:hypothetical protein